jgi:hypothetical protein
MKGLFFGLVAALTLAVAVAPSAQAYRLGTSTCPVNASTPCVGGGR